MIALPCPHCKDITLFFVVHGQTRGDADTELSEQDCACELGQQEVAEAEQRALDELLSGAQRV